MLFAPERELDSSDIAFLRLYLYCSLMYTPSCHALLSRIPPSLFGLSAPDLSASDEYRKVMPRTDKPGTDSSDTDSSDTDSSDTDSSDVDLPDADSDLLVKERTHLEPPALYKVILLNDDYTPMEFVVGILEALFSRSHQEAIQIMFHVHNKGVGVCGLYPHEVAETKAAQVMSLARRNEHPLQCVIEKEED